MNFKKIHSINYNLSLNLFFSSSFIVSNQTLKKFACNFPIKLNRDKKVICRKWIFLKLYTKRNWYAMWCFGSCWKKICFLPKCLFQYNHFLRVVNAQAKLIKIREKRFFSPFFGGEKFSRAEWKSIYSQSSLNFKHCKNSFQEKAFNWVN